MKTIISIVMLLAGALCASANGVDSPVDTMWLTVVQDADTLYLPVNSDGIRISKSKEDGRKEASASSTRSSRTAAEHDLRRTREWRKGYSVTPDSTYLERRFDRGIGKVNSCFIPKGTVGAGISFSYNNYSLGNGADDSGFSALLSIIQDIHGDMMGFGVAPFISYFIKDNLSVGVRFNYERSNLGLDNLNINIMEDMGLTIHGFRHLNQSYTGSLTLRNYIPFAASKRFAMFAEVRATGGYGQSKTYKVIDNEKYGTYQDIYKFELGLVPGLVAFITNEVAFEISVGLLGFDYHKIVQTENQVDVSVLEKSGANFKVNLFSIGFGLSFNIQTQKSAENRKNREARKK